MMNKNFTGCAECKKCLDLKGIETPMIDPTQAKNERRESIAKHMNEE